MLIAVCGYCIINIINVVNRYIGFDGRVGLYQAAQPLSASNRHFELEILDTGGRGAIGKGIYFFVIMYLT